LLKGWPERALKCNFAEWEFANGTGLAVLCGAANLLGINALTADLHILDTIGDALPSALTGWKRKGIVFLCRYHGPALHDIVLGGGDRIQFLGARRYFIVQTPAPLFSLDERIDFASQELSPIGMPVSALPSVYDPRGTIENALCDGGVL
jgi:hypothetical protein